MGGIHDGGRFRASDKKEQFWVYVDKAKGKVRIIEFQVREVAHLGDRAARALNRDLSILAPESPTVQTVTFPQKWHYTEKDKHWRVYDSGFGAIVKTRAGF